ncbi:hypothetical protein B0I35DRAFT_436666 [Stachybotrys elegans]|uniref:Uncharacterized protein n=1 Tax=Stachybotrys elegans TaxID=80388 RepID=A0A8K0SJR2_9HYPO|nr:hypothetical protein B0I35DRAFT_436666 [Stachybotrys elegans]
MCSNLRARVRPQLPLGTDGSRPREGEGEGERERGRATWPAEEVVDGEVSQLAAWGSIVSFASANGATGWVSYNLTLELAYQIDLTAECIDSWLLLTGQSVSGDKLGGEVRGGSDSGTRLPKAHDGRCLPAPSCRGGPRGYPNLSAPPPTPSICCRLELLDRTRSVACICHRPSPLSKIPTLPPPRMRVREEANEGR